MSELWRTTNPSESDPHKVRWEKVSALDQVYAPYLLDVDGQTIYVSLVERLTGVQNHMVRSVDGGKSWQKLSIP